MNLLLERSGRKILLSAFVVFLHLYGYSSVYYLAPNGNDNNSGTITSPWFSFTKAWTLIKPGDTVYLRGGTYAFTSQQVLRNKSGQAGNLINILAYPGEFPVLTKGAGYPNASGFLFCGNYFYWKGLEITGFTQPNGSVLSYGFRAENSSNNVFEQFKVHGNGAGMNIANYGYVEHVTGNLVLNCDFYENQDPLTTSDPYGNADGLSIESIGHTDDVNIVRGCRFWWNSDDGLDMFSNDGLVIIENCQSFFNGYIPKTFTKAGDGTGFKFGNSLTDNRTTVKRIVRRCLAAKNRMNGYSTNLILGLVEMSYCTAYSNGKIGIHLADYNLSHSAKNCLSYSNNPDVDLSNQGSYITNSWQNNIVVSSNDFKSIDVNLLLTPRQSNGDIAVTDFFRLNKTSQLIDSGTDIGLDFNGSAPDIGCYEYSQALDAVTSNENVSICEGANYCGWTTSGTYTRTLKATSGADSIVTTYLTVNPLPAVSFLSGPTAVSLGSANNVYITQPGMSNYSWEVSPGGIVTAGGNSTSNTITVSWTTSGKQYVSVNYTNANGCTALSSATDSVTVTDNMPPYAFKVTGGGSFCEGGTGLSIGLSGSEKGVNYQLYQNGIAVGKIVEGTGKAITFGIQNSSGTYTAGGIKTNNSMRAAMSGNAIINIHPTYTIAEDIIINQGESYNGWTTDGKYQRTLSSVYGCDSIVITNLVVLSLVKDADTQTIVLKKGINLISSYLVPTNPQVVSVFSLLISNGQFVKLKNEMENEFSYNSQANSWVDNIVSMSTTEGYVLEVSSDCSLKITGTLISAPLGIPLKAGWNIISYPKAIDANAIDVLQSLIDHNKLIKVQDELGNSIENFNNYGGWQNNIGNFQPGKAYKVYVSADTVLTVQPNYSAPSTVIPSPLPTTHYTVSYEGNGVNHMNINIVGLNNQPYFLAGDEIAVFDGSICVGALKITDEHLSKGFASIVSSYMTNKLIPDGFTEGHAIRLKKWNTQSGEEAGVTVKVLSGAMLFSKNASTMIELQSLTTDPEQMFVDPQVEIYPNPCNDRVFVRFSKLPSTGSCMYLLDNSGKIVSTVDINQPTEELPVHNYPAGVYMLKIIDGATSKVYKIVVNH